MAKYNYKCEECEEEVVITMPITDFLKLTLDGQLYVGECKVCNIRSKFVRIFKKSSSRISKGKAELIDEAKEEAREMVHKINMGDSKAIRDIYGDDN
jgi:hypothetical protein